MTNELAEKPMSYEEMIDTLKGLVFGTFDRTTFKEREALGRAIDLLSNSDEDCISRKAVLDEFYEHFADDDLASIDDYENYTKIVKALPSIQPKTGHWIKYGIPRCGEQHYKCTNCDEYFNFGLYSDYYKKAFKYCPNCGCHMVEPQESEDKE